MAGSVDQFRESIPAATVSPEDEMFGAARVRALERLIAKVPREKLSKMGREQLDRLVDVTAEQVADEQADEGKHFRQRPKP